MTLNNLQITIIGLGYVGLPLAVEFGKKYPTIGFDINEHRIHELQEGKDRTRELKPEEIKKARNLTFTTSLVITPSTSALTNIYIVTVPTPIDQFKKPDLTYLLSASKSVGLILQKGDIVIYESTVYPGCTEEDCVPVLEKYSSLKFNVDFYCGYSPERINPSDKVHTVTKIKKVTSGSTEEIAEFINSLYASIIEAGTFKASSIKVAEAAKVIENCQRDINIAFVNELALIFDRMNIDTLTVLEAAGTKWNFSPFKPGLVGGQCIGVHPYYLTYKAESLGYHPQVILSGRRVNENMGKHIALETIKLLIKKNIIINNARILVLGITFKENCPDIRNSRVIDIVSELKDYGIIVDIFDPWVSIEEIEQQYQISLKENLNFDDYVGIILAVSHDQFNEPYFIKSLETFKGIVFDVKGQLNTNLISKRL